ncbi:SIMPL domain-containing protein [Acidocella sp.]|uniref:SIMPL domain-containing protein n=1 Tax=Acidocella sp. TaxID=50710 RepID=UPI00260D45B0|nr:SIMPL domain-containing protein [Acidocella sp.]
MTRTFWFLVPILMGAAMSAKAQTVLTLSANGTVRVAPDEVVASFNVQEVQPSAAGAQEALNQAMAKALAAARSVPNVVIITGGYESYASTPDDHSKRRFTSQQSLTLIQPVKDGAPGKTFNYLLARLQADGLMLNGLRGDLSKKRQAAAKRAAICDALTQLRVEADGIADALHKKVGALKTLNVNTSNGKVPPGPLIIAMAAAAPGPQSAPGKITITANVSAVFDLE